MEWTNPYNPFNSWKVLAWTAHLEGCASEQYLPPVSVNLDLANACNSSCPYCIAWLARQGKEYMPSGFYKILPSFLARWGVKSVCIAGGGESTLHPEYVDWLEALHGAGLQIGVITNGRQLSPAIIKAMANYCRWVGFSVDAGTEEAYMKMHGLSSGKDLWTVLNNVASLRRAYNGMDICVKFLIHPYSVGSIAEGARLAKEHGANSFHIRPLGWKGFAHPPNVEVPDMASIVGQANRGIEAAQRLEDDNFKVYAVRHKFTHDYQNKTSFSGCWASPLTVTLAPDGWAYMCCDKRGEEHTRLERFYPEPDRLALYWGSTEHVRQVRAINPQECPRCTFTPYQEIIEKVIVADAMCRNFP